jgi:hypothetical protein
VIALVTVRCHGVVFGQVAFAVRALIDHLFAVRGHGDHAGNLLGVAFLTQQLIDLSLALHGVTSRLFFERGDLLPGCLFPQACVAGRRAGRGVVMNAGGAERRGSDRTATLAIICGELACIVGDLKGYPRYLDRGPDFRKRFL